MLNGAADAVAAARRLVDAAERVTVLTGAGISTDSGLPDFRGPKGLWTKDPAAERASNINVYVSDPEVRRSNWARRASGALWADVEPNRGHEALVHLEKRGKLHLLITQNVDELHQRAGSDPERVVEIHGTTRKVQCLSCDYRDDIEVALERVRAGEEDPECPLCGWILKSATVSFGQSLKVEGRPSTADHPSGTSVYSQCTSVQGFQSRQICSLPDTSTDATFARQVWPLTGSVVAWFLAQRLTYWPLGRGVNGTPAHCCDIIGVPMGALERDIKRYARELGFERVASDRRRRSSGTSARRCGACGTG